MANYLTNYVEAGHSSKCAPSGKQIKSLLNQFGQAWLAIFTPMEVQTWGCRFVSVKEKHIYIYFQLILNVCIFINMTPRTLDYICFFFRIKLRQSTRLKILKEIKNVSFKAFLFWEGFIRKKYF